jgi:hypothetical protein
VQHNLVIFQHWRDAALRADVENNPLDAVPPPPLPPVVDALYLPLPNPGGRPYTPAKAITRLVPVVQVLEYLTNYAESDDADACHFETQLSTFIRGLRGENNLLYMVDGKTHSTPIDNVIKDVPLARSVVESLRYSIAYYFERRLHEDWGLLLCLVLHPTSSGCPARNAATKPWPCLKGRFKDMKYKEEGHWVTVDADSKMQEVMEAGEAVLEQELQLQYEMENFGALQEPAPGSAAASANRADGAAAASDLASPSPKRYRLLIEEEQVQPQAVAASTAKEAARAALKFWRERPSVAADTQNTLLEFWHKTTPSLLRNVALRAGAFLVSQCATERVNKIPNEIWADDRRRTLPTHVARDVVVSRNMDKFPEPKLDWGKK